MLDGGGNIRSSCSSSAGLNPISIAARFSITRAGVEAFTTAKTSGSRSTQARAIGSETLDYEKVDVPAELREMSGGRGPDVCIEAVGMEAHSPGPQYLYDQVKQQMRLQTDRPEQALAVDLDEARAKQPLGKFAGQVRVGVRVVLHGDGLRVAQLDQHDLADRGRRRVGDLHSLADQMDRPDPGGGGRGVAAVPARR